MSKNDFQDEAEAHLDKEFATLLDRWRAHVQQHEIAKEYLTYKEHSGVMVAIPVRSTLARRMQPPREVFSMGADPVPAEEYHLTVAYLGKAENYSIEDFQDLHQIIKDLAASLPRPRIIVPGSVSRFVGVEEGHKDAIYADATSEDLQGIARLVVARLAQATTPWDVAFQETYTPHITLAYISTGDTFEYEFEGDVFQASHIGLYVAGERSLYPFSEQKERRPVIRIETEENDDWLRRLAPLVIPDVEGEEE
jgi:2'-5' RNA ligase